MRKVRMSVLSIGGLIGLFLLSSILMGAKPDVDYQEPKAQIKVFGNSSGANEKYISTLTDVSSKLKNPIAILNTSKQTVTDSDVPSKSALWVHPSALNELSKDEIKSMKKQIKEGSPVIYMDKDAKGFFEKFELPEFEFTENENSESNVSIVGVAAVYTDPESIEYTVIQTPNDRIEQEGEKPAINAFIGATNEMMGEGEKLQ